VLGQRRGNGLLQALAARRRRLLDRARVEEQEDVGLRVLELAANAVPLELRGVLSGVTVRRPSDDALRGCAIF